jgi:hypothetical protein
MGAGISGAQQFVFSGVAQMVNLERPAEFEQLVLVLVK